MYLYLPHTFLLRGDTVIVIFVCNYFIVIMLEDADCIDIYIIYIFLLLFHYFYFYYYFIIYIQGGW